MTHPIGSITFQECPIHFFNNEGLVGVFEKFHILSYFSKLSLVCKRWKLLLEDNLFWKPIALTLRMSENQDSPIYLQIKTFVRLSISHIKDSDTLIDVAEVTGREFDDMRLQCLRNPELNQEDKNYILSAIDTAAFDKIDRFQRIKDGFNAILHLSRIGKSNLQKAEHYADQLSIKSSSSEYFENLIYEAIYLGHLGQARAWMSKVNDSYALASIRLALVRMYCDQGELRSAIEETKLISEDHQKGMAISELLASIAKDNYPLREEAILLGKHPYLDLYFLIKDLVEANKMSEAKNLDSRHSQILNNPPEYLLGSQAEMDVWFGRAKRVFERIKQLDFEDEDKATDNLIQLYTLRNSLEEIDPDSELLIEIKEMISQLPIKTALRKAKN